MSVATVVPMLEVLGMRRGPQDLPADQAVLVFWMGASLLSGVLVAAPLHGFAASLMLGFLDLGLLYLFVLAALSFQSHPERWLQTYTAMVGVSALLGLVMAGLLWVFPPDFEAGGAAPGLVAYLALLVWLLVAFGHILQNALSLGTRFAGVTIALAFLIVSSAITQLALGLVSG